MHVTNIKRPDSPNTARDNIKTNHSTLGFKDNRPEASQQLKVQRMANSYVDRDAKTFIGANPLIKTKAVSSGKMVEPVQLKLKIGDNVYDDKDYNGTKTTVGDKEIGRKKAKVKGSKAEVAVNTAVAAIKDKDLRKKCEMYLMNLLRVKTEYDFENEKRLAKAVARIETSSLGLKDRNAKKEEYSSSLVKKLNTLPGAKKWSKEGTNNKAKLVFNSSSDDYIAEKKSYKDQRDIQMQRWISTMLFERLKSDGTNPVEVQGAIDNENDQLIVSSNTNAANKKIKELAEQKDFLEDLAEELKDHKSDRIKRHARKFLGDKYDVKRLFKNGVITPEFEKADFKDGYHAELRIVKYAEVKKLDLTNTSGVKRPCLACGITLTSKGKTVGSVGPVWLSDAAMQPIKKLIEVDKKLADFTPQELKKLAQKINREYKKMDIGMRASGKKKKEYIYDVGSSSDSSISESSESDESMESDESDSSEVSGS